MKQIALIISVLILYTGMTSCNSSGTHKAEIQTLDSLQVVLDDAVKQYQEWNIDSLVTIKKKMDLDVETVGNTFVSRGDTMTFAQSVLMGNYKSSSKVFRDVAGRNAKYLEEIEVANTQLATLKDNLKRGAITDEMKLSTYMFEEKKAVNTLVEGLQSASVKFNNGLSAFERLQPKVVHLLDSLNSGNNY